MEDEEYLIQQQEYYENWIPKKLSETCEKLGIELSDVEYKSKTAKDSNGWVNTKFTGWSKDYVFVIRHYDGWENIVAIPRNPVEEDFISEKIGGG